MRVQKGVSWGWMKEGQIENEILEYLNVYDTRRFYPVYQLVAQFWVPGPVNTDLYDIM